MNSENSTENPARLPLAERAWQGLLLQEPLLSLEDVAELEHPDDPASQARLRAALETDIRFFSNLACLVVADDGWFPGTWMIYREAYREWRTTCPPKLLPGSSRRIDLWLGATPAIETSLPAIPSLPEPVAQGGAAEKSAALQSLLAEIDKRAAEQGAGFARNSLPGTKAEFHELLKAYCTDFRYIGLSATAGYLKGVCKFQHGVNPEHGKGAAVWALFPEYPDLKLG